MKYPTLITLLLALPIASHAAPVHQTAMKKPTHHVASAAEIASAAHSTFLRASARPAGDHSFPDVPKNHWAAAAVETLRQRGIVKGYPAGK